MSHPITRRAALATAGALLATRAQARTRPSSEAALAALVAGGSVALIRHARAPGTGDPPGFRLGACETQRNLDETGRRQATDLGRRLRDAGIGVSEVRTSRWCRARDTAALAFPDVTIQPEPALDSFFANSQTAPRQTREARALIAAWTGRPGVLVLVTHAVNIDALSDINPQEGEVVVMRPRGETVEVVGRWR